MVGALIYRKKVDEAFIRRLPAAQCAKPLLRDTRNGAGHLVFYPGQRILAAHTDFLKSVPPEHFDDAVVLGEMLRQRDVVLVEAGANLLCS